VAPMGDAMEGLRSAAEDGNARRRQTRMVVISLLVLMTVNLASVLGVGVLFLHDRQRQGRDRQNMEVGSKIVSDLYSVANDTNAAVHRIEGSPVPPAAQPPVTPLPLTRRTTTTTRRPSTSPPATSASTTTQPSSPPTTGAPAPSQPPQTTTTTRPRRCAPVPTPIPIPGC
jgi:hypothetical protein